MILKIFLGDVVVNIFKSISRIFIEISEFHFFESFIRLISMHEFSSDSESKWQGVVFPAAHRIKRWPSFQNLCID